MLFLIKEAKEFVNEISYQDSGSAYRDKDAMGPDRYAIRKELIQDIVLKLDFLVHCAEIQVPEKLFKKFEAAYHAANELKKEFKTSFTSHHFTVFPKKDFFSNKYSLRTNSMTLLRNCLKSNNLPNLFAIENQVWYKSIFNLQTTAFQVKGE